MPYTSLLGLSLPTTGSLSGTWGDEVNNAITSLLDSAVAGTTTLSTDADVTLTSTDGAANQARSAIILWTAGGTVTRNITAPARSKAYVVINATSSSQSIVIRGSGPTTGVTVIAGRKALVAWNGSDFVEVAGGLVNLTSGVTGTLPVANGGTGAATFTANNVLLGNGTSAFQVVAPGANGNVLTSNGTTWVSSTFSGGSALSAITAATGSATIANGNNPIAWNWTQTTASQTGFAIGETTASTGGAGAQYLMKVATLASSTAKPFGVVAQGTTIVDVSASGAFSLTGNTVTLNALSGTLSVQGSAGSGVSLLSAGTVSSASGNVNISVGDVTVGSFVAGILTLQGGSSRAAQVGNSGGIRIVGGNAGAVASVAGGPVQIIGGNGTSTTTGGVGGAITIQAGTGGLAASGGTLTISGGNADATGTGGPVSITGGQAGLSSGTGGSVTIQSGGSPTSGASGTVTIVSGATNSGATGAVSFGSGNATGGASGSVTISSGTSNTVAVGDITIQQPTTIAAVTNGIRILGAAAGATASLAGGPISLTAGAGSTTTTGGVGGAVTITAGAGGLAATGGAATLKAGNGGATGAGGSVAITAGNGNSALGGDITLTTGTGSTNGAVNFVNTNVANGTVATTLTSLGPTGASTTVVGWLKIKVGGTTQYIPYW